MSTYLWCSGIFIADICFSDWARVCWYVPVAAASAVDYT